MSEAAPTNELQARAEVVSCETVEKIYGYLNEYITAAGVNGVQDIIKEKLLSFHAEAILSRASGPEREQGKPLGGEPDHSMGSIQLSPFASTDYRRGFKAALDQAANIVEDLGDGCRTKDVVETIRELAAAPTPVLQGQSESEKMQEKLEPLPGSDNPRYAGCHLCGGGGCHRCVSR